MVADTPAIEFEHVTASYGAAPALLDVNLRLPAGKLIGVIGPNGSGKSTLMKVALGFLRADFGTVRIFGNPREQAVGRVAYVPQRGGVDWTFPVTVGEVALMGRYNHRRWWQDLTAEDRRVANEALATVRMSEFRDRQIGELSGGQQQRVFMARALAQGADILLLDEPFAGVDAATERAILEVLRLSRESGRTLLVVHHDLATAAEFFDVLVLIKQRVYAVGSPEDVLAPELLAEVYEGRTKAFQALLGARRAP